MRRFHFLYLASVVSLCIPVTGYAEVPKPQRVTFKTFDKVALIGTYYPSGAEGKRSPIVLMLHKIGGNSQVEGWKALAKMLQDQGMAVLTFDYRGHGDSVSVEKEFWQLTTNARGIKGANLSREKITFKDFSPAYYPMLVNDIAAAKFFIEDKLNNGEECNVSETILVGAEDGAALGAMWLTSEWIYRKQLFRYDPLFMRNIPNGYRPAPDGKDVAAAVWLSLRENLGGTKLRLPVSRWLGIATVRTKVPMCFFYGQQDAGSAKVSQYLHNRIVNKGGKLKTTFQVPIKGTKLAGNELLGKEGLGTDKLIARYLKEKVLETRPSEIWTKRETRESPLQLIPLQTLNKLGVRLP